MEASHRRKISRDSRAMASRSPVGRDGESRANRSSGESGIRADRGHESERRECHRERKRPSSGGSVAVVGESAAVVGEIVVGSGKRGEGQKREEREMKR